MVAEGAIVIEVRITVAVGALVQREHMYHGREHWKKFSVQYTPKKCFIVFCTGNFMKAYHPTCMLIKKKQTTNKIEYPQCRKLSTTMKACTALYSSLSPHS